MDADLAECAEVGGIKSDPVLVDAFPSGQNQMSPSPVNLSRSLFYADTRHRDWSTARLNTEAIGAFLDTLMLRDRHLIAREVGGERQWEARGASASSLPPVPAIERMLKTSISNI